MALVAAGREGVPEDPGPFASFVEGPLRTAVVQSLGLSSYDVVAERLAHVLHMATSQIKSRPDLDAPLPKVLDTEPWVEEDSRVRLTQPPLRQAPDDASGGEHDIPLELEALWESPSEELLLPVGGSEDSEAITKPPPAGDGADDTLAQLARDLEHVEPPASGRRRLARIDSSGSHPRPAFLNTGRDARRAPSYREVDARPQSGAEHAAPRPATRALLACTLDLALVEELRRRVESLEACGGSFDAPSSPFGGTSESLAVTHVGTVGDLLARLTRADSCVVLIDVALPSIDAPTVAQLAGSFPPGVRVLVWGMTASQLQRFAVVFPVAASWIPGGLAGSPLDALLTSG